MKLVIAASTLMALVIALPASAMVLGLDWGLGQSTAHIAYQGHSMDVWAGKIAAYLGGTLGNPLPPIDGHFSGYVFCVDLQHTIGLPTEYEVDRFSTSSLANGGRAAWLYENYVGQADTQTKAAAMQLAIWDIVSDNGDGFSSGDFHYMGGLGSATENEAANLLAASAGRSSANATYYHARGPYGQSMIGAVPEPGTISLLVVGLGLSFTGMALRRKNKV